MLAGCSASKEPAAFKDLSDVITIAGTEYSCADLAQLEQTQREIHGTNAIDQEFVYQATGFTLQTLADAYSLPYQDKNLLATAKDGYGVVYDLKKYALDDILFVYEADGALLEEGPLQVMIDGEKTRLFAKQVVGLEFVDAQAETSKITFPAYEDKSGTEFSRTVNDTPAFQVEFPLQEGWSLKEQKGDEIVPTGEFYTPLYLYNGEQLIGYIGFSPFVFDLPEDTPKQGAYPAVFSNLRLSQFYSWEPYTCIKETENGEVGVVSIQYMNPEDIENHPGAMPDVERLETTGILAYDMEQKVSVGIAFLPDIVSAEQAAELAKEVQILPAAGAVQGKV